MTVSQGSLLVVDDDAMNRDMLSRRLARHGPGAHHHPALLRNDGRVHHRKQRDGQGMEFTVRLPVQVGSPTAAVIAPESGVTLEVKQQRIWTGSPNTIT